MATAAAPTEKPKAELSREDQTLLLFAGLMEGGKEDDETVIELDRLTKVLNNDVTATKKGEESICTVIDSDCVDTLLGYLDMRQPEIVRGHATLTTSAYLQAAGDEGAKELSAFFFERLKRGTYDDYIVAFSVAGAVFPIVPDFTAKLFLEEGFLASLGPLMRRKWKSRKVETACLDMLNVACMNSACRAAVQKYCMDWLEEIVDQDPDDVVKDMYTTNTDNSAEGSISMRRHSRQVQNKAAVILAKIKATIPPGQQGQPGPDGDSGRVEQASTSVEDLSKLFTNLLLTNPEQGQQNSVEGLAYLSLQPKVKEELASNPEFLKGLVQTLKDAPPKSSLTYGALSIFGNLTRYQPVESEEQKRINQLKAYANAAGKLQETIPFNDDEHVSKRCRKIFDAGVTPILVSHSKNGSSASLGLIINIIFSLATVRDIRGQLAQQGAVRLLIAAWTALPADTESATRRIAAQALARILVSTDPSLVFGGTRAIPMSAAIRPLASLLTREDALANPSSSLLPVFESLMALTNLASVDDDMRRAIIRSAWSDVQEQLLSSNKMVTRAGVELICNIVQAPDGIALYADGSQDAKQRLHILVALADAEDDATRSASGGALAGLTTFDGVVTAIVERPRGIEIMLGMCKASESEDLRHRGVVTVYNMVSCEGEVGEKAREAFRKENGVSILTECAKASRRPEVVECAVFALKAILGDKEVKALEA